MTESLDPGFELLPGSPPAPPRRHGRLIGSTVAVVLLAGGGVASYVAFAGSDSGTDSPKGAVQKVITDLEHADLVGFVDDLAPGERTALAAPIRDDVGSLKRLGVLSGSADPSAVSGFSFKANDFVYADKTIRINDHVQLVQITGGSVDVSADAAKLPLTKRILQFAGGSASATHEHHTIAADGKPVRIAAQQVGGKWYASLFYTAADQAAGGHSPKASDAVPAKGAANARAAVQNLVRAALNGDLRAALELVSPAELGAVHDYGGLILDRTPGWHRAPVRLTTLDLTTTPIADGGVRVGLHRLVAAGGGQRLSVTIDNGCVRVAGGGTTKKVCAADAADLVTDFLGAASCAVSSSVIDGGFGSESGSGSANGPLNDGGVSISNDSGSGACQPLEFTPGQKRAITDIFRAITQIGVTTAQVDGSWYVTPVRTFADEGATVLSNLKGDDLFQLARLGR
jgi:hypothetical protein